MAQEANVSVRFRHSATGRLAAVSRGAGSAATRAASAPAGATLIRVLGAWWVASLRLSCAAGVADGVGVCGAAAVVLELLMHPRRLQAVRWDYLAQVAKERRKEGAPAGQRRALFALPFAQVHRRFTPPPQCVVAGDGAAPAPPSPARAVTAPAPVAAPVRTPRRSGELQLLWDDGGGNDDGGGPGVGAGGTAGQVDLAPADAPFDDFFAPCVDDGASSHSSAVLSQVFGFDDHPAAAAEPADDVGAFAQLAEGDGGDDDFFGGREAGSGSRAATTPAAPAHDDFFDAAPPPDDDFFSDPTPAAQGAVPSSTAAAAAASDDFFSAPVGAASHVGLAGAFLSAPSSAPTASKPSGAADDFFSGWG